MSVAEIRRKHTAKHQAEHREVLAAADARGKAAYDASHFYWQPVGGRNVVPKPRNLAEGALGGNTRGNLMSKANQSNVDVVVFGRDQDASGASRVKPSGRRRGGARSPRTASPRSSRSNASVIGSAAAETAAAAPPSPPSSSRSLKTRVDLPKTSERPAASRCGLRGSIGLPEM